MAWEAFNWGSRGPHYKTGVEGIYVAHIFIANGIQVNVVGQGAELQKLMHVLHVLSPVSPPEYTDCQAVADTVSAWVTNSYRHMWPSAVQSEIIVATGMNAVPAAQAVTVNTIAGDRSGTAMDQAKTLRIDAYGRTNGRRRHGCFYSWPGVISDAVGSVATVAYAAALVNVWSTLAAALTTAGYPLMIWSKTAGALYPVSRLASLDRVMDNQGRRSPGRGP